MDFGVLFFVVCSVWVVSEIMLVFLKRSKIEGEDRDKGSIKWLNLTIYSSVALAIFFNRTGFGIIHSGIRILPRIGTILILAGLIIRWIAILTLRKFFTTNVAIQSDHRIIKSGLYRFVRHPSYSGSILSFLGLGLVLCNWMSMIVLVVPITIAFLKRIRIEEEALYSTFGEEYAIYCNSTRILLPGIY
jgi:protein-S-isoprenylcysteine O-methyltransferase Ste14